ncbi:MAG: hypothetical protein AABX98_02965, partial [Nanoarchaeota archaeon]
YVSVVFFLLVAYAVLKKKQSKQEKYILFWSMVLILSIATLYLAAYTLTVTLLSVTNGPVHWHADFEVWICGEKQFIPESTGLSGKIGSSLLHHHNDYRIHIEGAVMDYEDIMLAQFFQDIGGSLGQNYIGISQEDGSVAYWQNGDYCPDGKEGMLRLYVQRGFSEEWQEVAEIPSYIIGPYADVPPGDRLKLVFGTDEAQ